LAEPQALSFDPIIELAYHLGGSGLPFISKSWARARARSEVCGGAHAGTYFGTDPSQDMAVIFMIQNPEQRAYYRPVLRNMVYDALTNSTQ